MENIQIPQVIEERCPLWSARIKEETFEELEEPKEVEGQELDIGLFSCCVVGEARLFKPCYYPDDPMHVDYIEGCHCEDCKKYADSFECIVLEKDPVMLQEILNRFSNHIVEHD